jgi:poly(hydroxyalkanoate) depolymerase family esterase
MNDFPHRDSMPEATRLTRAGRLAEATALLQRLLRGDATRDRAGGATMESAGAPAGRPTRLIDVTPHAIKATDRQLSSPVGQEIRAGFRSPGIMHVARPHTPEALRSLLERVKRVGSGLGLPGLEKPFAVPTPDILPDGGQFLARYYSNHAGSRAYKLYIPSGYHGQALPLIIMLHGCTQSPDDFAAGTRMNLIAEEQTCLVVYPAQPSEANAAKCWNWFRPSDQRRGQGEPSLIAGITSQVMCDYSVDPQRVYIGGLSAGAAAAAVMGVTYPDLYAAICVHSGLAWGAANDIPSAFAAMRQGELSASSRSGDMSAVLEHRSAVPTIVFHGDRDNTVHPRNGDHVISQTRTKNLQKSVHRGRVPGGRAYTRTIHTDASGRAILEHWEIHGAGHAWSGGSPAGSYTDPRGPDAAREMLRFFLEHPSPTAAP